MGLLDIKVPANKEFIEGKGLNQRGKKLQTLKIMFLKTLLNIFASYISTFYNKYKMLIQSYSLSY